MGNFMYRLGIFFLLIFSQVQLAPIVPLETKSLECWNCEKIVKVIENQLGEEVVEDCIGDIIIGVCSILQLYDHFICKTMVSSFVEEYVWIAQQIIVTPTQVCGLLIPDCDPIFNPFNQTWTLDMPPGKPAPVLDPPVPKPGMPTLSFLHLSDIHLDMYYTPGMEADCPEPQCCRPQNNPDEMTADATSPPPIKRPAGYWGTVGSCDSPYWLFTSMLQHAAANHPKLDYILVSGDLMSHADWVYSRESHARNLRNISTTIRSFFPKIPVYFAVGNHEGVPIDNFTPHFAPPQFNMSYLYDTMADDAKDFLPNDQLKMVQWNGCFVQHLYQGLRLISLNSGLGDSNNFWLYVNETDPDGTMSWFINQLLEAEKAGDKVHVLAHIPTGGGESTESWSANYYNAINRFENTVVGQFFGHTHSEEFEVMYEDMNDPKSRPTGVIYSAPSLTPYSDYFPGYRVVTIDGKYSGTTYQVIDWEEWRLDLDKANADPPNAKWEMFYDSAAKAYGLKDFWPRSWNDFIDRMKTDDDLFGRYRTNYYRRTKLPDCNADCKRGFLCDARKAHHTNTMCADLYPEGEPSVNKQEPQKKLIANPTIDDVRAAMNKIKKRVVGDDKCKF